MSTPIHAGLSHLWLNHFRYASSSFQILEVQNQIRESPESPKNTGL